MAKSLNGKKPLTKSLHRDSKAAPAKKSTGKSLSSKWRKPKSLIVEEPKVPWPSPIGRRNKDGLHTFAYADRPDNIYFKPIIFGKGNTDIAARTVYVVDFKRELIVQMTTTFTESTGRDVKVGWAMCRACSRSLTNCVCSRLTPPQYITEWHPKPTYEDRYASSKEDEPERKPRRRKTLGGTDDSNVIKAAKRFTGKRNASGRKTLA